MTSTSYTALVSSPKHVLVADDDPMLADLITRIVQKLGFTVLTARDGATAVARMLNHDGPLHCAILDISMPVMHGVDVAYALRQHAPHIPIVFVSGYVPQHLLPLIQQLDGVRVLHKPFTITELRAVLQTLSA